MQKTSWRGHWVGSAFIVYPTHFYGVSICYQKHTLLMLILKKLI